MANISVDQVSNEIARLMTEYTEDVVDGIDKLAYKTAKDVLKDVKAAAQAADFHSENYSKGFVINKYFTPNNRRYVVWNKKYYRLVHLLEKGHIIATGKRKGERTRAFPHMEPAERKNIPLYEEGIKDIIRNGGG